MYRLIDLLNNLEVITQDIRKELEPTYVYGYSLERCPNNLLEKYVKVAEEHIAKKELELHEALTMHKPLREALFKTDYEKGLILVQKELKERAKLGIIIKEM